MRSGLWSPSILEANLLKFLKKSSQFVIPIYQRNYSWLPAEMPAGCGLTCFARGCLTPCNDPPEAQSAPETLLHPEDVALVGRPARPFYPSSARAAHLRLGSGASQEHCHPQTCLPETMTLGIGLPRHTNQVTLARANFRIFDAAHPPES